MIVIIRIFAATTAQIFAIFNPSSALQQLYNKVATENPLEDIGGKASVSNLFDKALQDAKNTEFTQNFQNLQSLTQYVQSWWDGSCSQVTQDDIFAVLYSSSSDFRILYREGLPPNQRAKTLYNLSAVQACQKIVICSTNQDPVTYRHTLARQSSCEDQMQVRYAQYNSIASTMNAFSARTIDENIFQNGTIEDSDYDIVYDIARIGDLFFVWFTPPVQTIFYQFPWNISTTNVPSPSANNFNNNIGPWDFVSSMLTNNIQQAQENDTWTSQEEEDWEDELQAEVEQGLEDGWEWWSIIWTDIISFIDTTNQSPTPVDNPSNPTQTIPGNMCIVPLTIEPLEGQPQEDVVTQEEFEIYDEILTEYADTIFAADRVDGLLRDGALQAWWWDDDDDDATTDLQQTANTISSMIDAALWLDEPAGQCQAECADLSWWAKMACQAECNINSCQSECSGLPPFDQTMCQLQCLCNEVETGPMTNNRWDEVVPAGAFSIRFCQVPAQPIQIRKWAPVFSIEDIVTEVRSILDAMRRGGKLFKRVRTEEFLDLGLKKNDFGEMFVFNLQIATKPTYDNSPAASYAKQLEAKNKTNQITILSRYEDPTIPQERNKYLVIASPAEQAARVEWLIDPWAFATQQQANIQASAMPTYAWQELLKLTQLEKNAIIHESIAIFLQNNLTFRQTVETYLLDIQGTSQALKNKIEKAK